MIAILGVISMAAVPASYAISKIFENDFFGAVGSKTDIVGEQDPLVPYVAFGSEVTNFTGVGEVPVVQSDFPEYGVGDGAVQLNMLFSATTPPFLSFGMQRDFSPVIDLTDAYIYIDIYTNLSASVDDLLSIKLIDSDGSEYRTADSALKAYPAQSEGKVRLIWDVSEVNQIDGAAGTIAGLQLNTIESILLLSLKLPAFEPFPAISGDVFIDTIGASTEFPIPEPASLVLLGSAVFGLLKMRKRS